MNYEKQYYSIAEVSKITNIEQYVLRYWETEFDILKPQKNRARNRIYKKSDIDIILKIRFLLREKKLTIEDAKLQIDNPSTKYSTTYKSPANISQPYINYNPLEYSFTEFGIKKPYYSISEVSKLTELEQYVLRYWETEFNQLKPAKNRAGNRIYTRNDIRTILFIKNLLRNQKCTIDAAKKILKETDSELIIDFDELRYEKPIFLKKDSIIVVTDNIIQQMIKDFTKNPEKLKYIDSRKFEEIVAELYRGFGYEVELTKQTRDGGKDIIAIKKAEVNVKYLIECKRPDPDNFISISPVRELYGVRNSEKATKAILATTTSFTRDALRFFEMHKWELEPRDYYGILEWINDYLKIKNYV